MHKVTLWRWFHDAAIDAGLPPGRRHPHLARHTAATELYRKTKDPLLVQAVPERQVVKMRLDKDFPCS